MRIKKSVYLHKLCSQHTDDWCVSLSAVQGCSLPASVEDHPQLWHFYRDAWCRSHSPPLPARLGCYLWAVSDIALVLVICVLLGSLWCLRQNIRGLSKKKRANKKSRGCWRSLGQRHTKGVPGVMKLHQWVIQPDNKIRRMNDIRWCVNHCKVWSVQ